MSVNITKRLKLYETTVFFRKDSPFTGVESQAFQITDGSRIVFTLQILSISLGATVQLKIKNGFSVDLTLPQIEVINANAIGSFSKVVSDFHNIFDMELTVSGGTATLAVGVSVADNAMTTRIENAEIKVDLSHIANAQGIYDSVRIGDGLHELNINPDGSLPVDVATNIRQKILDAADLIQVPSYSAVGNKYRLDSIVSTAVSIGAYTLTQTFTWADFGTKNERVTNIVWMVV